MTASALTRPGERDRLPVKIGQIEWRLAGLLAIVAGAGAMLLYSLVGAALCGSWVVFFRYLSHHPQLLQEGVGADFYHQEFLRAALGVLLYSAVGLLGAFLAPYVALVIFLALPIFYGFTSHGLYELGAVLRRR